MHNQEKPAADEAWLGAMQDLWFWPFGWWRSATEAWLNTTVQFLGGVAPTAGQDGEGRVGLAPGLIPVDPWAVLRAWMPHVEVVVVEPTAAGDGQEAAHVQMRVHIPGLSADEQVAVAAPVPQEGGAVIEAPVAQAAAGARRPRGPRKPKAAQSPKAGPDAGPAGA